MVIRWGTACAAVALAMLHGCTDLTEFDSAIKGGVNIFSAMDLSTVHTVQDIEGARSLCVIPDGFLVATTRGIVNRYDIDSYQKTGSFAVGNPSPSGFFEMEYSSSESSVYLIGSLGQIIELHIPDMEVLDNFSVCETPVDIEIATGIPYFYVAGANSYRIYEIRTQTNTVTRSVTLPSSPTCMAIDQSQDTILVGTLAETELVSTGGTGMRQRTMDQFPRILAVETIRGDTTLCAVFHSSTDIIAIIYSYFPEFLSSSGDWFGKGSIEGDTHYMCTDDSGSHTFVLSYLGNNTSRLVSYDNEIGFIDDQLDLPGYPMDLEYGDGKLLVLTTE